MSFCPTRGKLFCEYCRSEGEIDSESREAPEYRYYPDEDRFDAPRWEEKGTRTLTCPSCGADTVLSAGTVTASCPFCGSHYVTEMSEEDAKTSIRPESVVPFRISKEQASAAFAAWAKGRWLAPRAFRRGRHKSEMRGVYIPFFTFDAEQSTSYRGFGGRTRTERYTVRINGRSETRTRTVTEWFPISGTADLSFDDLPAPATRKIDMALFRRLGSYNMKVLNVYNPAYLAGFLAERYDVGVGEGFTHARQTMELRMEQFIKAERGYDNYRNMHYTHSYHNVRFKHFLLPLWIAHYRYRNKVYQFMLNGESGKSAGRAPVSVWKILAIVLGALGLLALLLLLPGLLEGGV